MTEPATRNVWVTQESKYSCKINKTFRLDSQMLVPFFCSALAIGAATTGGGAEGGGEASFANLLLGNDCK